MLKPGLIQSLPDLPAPLLTIYLNTDRAKPSNRTLEPKYMISLDSQATIVEGSLYPEDRKPFREQIERVEAYLRTYPPRSKGVVIFAGRDSWEFVALEVEIEDEVLWGAPGLAQLLGLLDEHKLYGIVAVGKKRTQFFLHWLGEMLELKDMEFTLEPSKEKEMGPVARCFGVRMSRGTNRDVYKRHIDARYSHYYCQIAENIRSWCEADHLRSVFLLALPEVISAVQKKMPQYLREKIVPVRTDLKWVTRTKLQRRIDPIVAEHEREREVGLVDALLGDSQGIVVGIEEVLVRLQQGRIRNLVVVKGQDARLKRCGECLWVDQSADPKCPVCGRERHTVSLREILPELARYYKVSVEVVSGEAAQNLQKVGGIGAWLREFEKKEYSGSA